MHGKQGTGRVTPFFFLLMRQIVRKRGRGSETATCLAIFQHRLLEADYFSAESVSMLW